MKHVITCLLFATGVSATGAAPANVYEAQGGVALVRSHESGLGQNVDWFGVTGFSSAGSCATYGGQVVMRLKDDKKGDRQMSLVLSALMAGRQVHVRVDDSVQDGKGYCYLVSIDVRP